MMKLTTRTRLLLTALAATLCTCPLHPAAAQDLTSSVGPLASTVSLGASGPWSVLVERGRLVLSDADDPGAVRFYSTEWQGDRATGRSAGVRVQATGMDGAAAGLIYNVRDEFPRWAALVVTPDKNVAVFARQATGLSEVKRVPIPGGPHAEGELLQISERAGVTTMLANGVEVLHFNSPTTGIGPVGILAIGPGRFSYRDFAFGQEVLPRGPGDDRVPAKPAPTAGNDDRVPTQNRTTPAPVPDGRRWPVPQLNPIAAGVLGATMGIVAHEFGHFIIGELKVPATGPEEDVADEFAALVFVDNMNDMPEQAAGMALSMAKFWWYLAEDKDKAGPQKDDWFDEHAPDRARFARIMCMLYGASPRVFEDVMVQTGIPERTRARCIDDERKRHAAWDNLLRKHRRRGVDPVMPGDLDPATPGKRISVTFQPPKNPDFTAVQTFLERSRMLDTAGDLLTRLYVLPRDTQLVVRECGMTNAFYNPQDGSVTLCYEMVGAILNTFDRHEGTHETVPGGAPAPRPTAPPATPPAPPPPESFNIAAFLAGTWHLQTPDDKGVSDDILVQASPDGTYRARHDVSLPNSQHIGIGVVGRWSAEATTTPRSYNLVLTPQQWSPQQICPRPDVCNPLNLTPTRLTVQIKDRNTLVSEGNQITRAQ